MQKVAVVALAVGIGALLCAPRAMAGSSPSQDAQFAVRCPAAMAWHSAHHDGMSKAERQKLEAVKPSDPELADQLAQRFERDQAAEQAAIKAGVFDESGAKKAEPPAAKHLVAVQTADLKWFKKTFAARGFPTLQQVGMHGVEHAFIIVQHANMDRPFQAKMLADMKPQLAAEPFLRNDYALLMDRVRSEAHQPQVYGTQFTTKNGKLVMDPTEDVAQLDARRATVGLMPIADYRCVLSVMYHVPEQGASSKP